MFQSFLIQKIGRKIALNVVTSARVAMILAVSWATLGTGSDAAWAVSAAKVLLPPDMIVINADVKTSDKDRPTAEAFAVLDGRFLAIGTTQEMRELAGPETLIIDVKSTTVIPGLIDGHIHLLMGMPLATGVNLSDIVDKNEWLNLIARKVATLQPGQWILGGGWNHALSDGVLPTRQMLDKVSPQNPVLLFDIDGHTTWASSLALKLANITAVSSVPDGAEIVLDPETGEPTGILKEGAANAIRALASYQAANNPKDGVLALVALANKNGFTSVHEMASDTSIYAGLAAKSELNLRVWAGKTGLRTTDDVVAYAAERDATIKLLVSSNEAGQGPMFKHGYVKLMVDGVLSTRTALMKEPYSDMPHVVAEAITDTKTLTTLVEASHENGFPVAIHAIGDKAVQNALDAFEAAGRKKVTLMDRIEHIEVATIVDEKRFIALSVAASMQPIHATCCVGDYVLDRIGAERMPNAYAWRRKLDKGLHLSLNSDWPTSPLSAFKHISAAMARKTAKDGGLKSWDKDQTLSFGEALYAYTQASADLSDWGDITGSITVGKWADFVVLSTSVNQDDPVSVAALQVQATYLAGGIVYEK